MCQDVPAYNFGKKYNKFAFRSLLTREESINAKGKVAIECNEVAGKCLYHVPTTKPMRIEEFEQTQAQVTSQVSVYWFMALTIVYVFFKIIFFCTCSYRVRLTTL